MKKSDIAKVMSHLGKLSAKKSPRPPEYYRRIRKMRATNKDKPEMSPE